MPRGKVRQLKMYDMRLIASTAIQRIDPTLNNVQRSSDLKETRRLELKLRANSVDSASECVKQAKGSLDSVVVSVVVRVAPQVSIFSLNFFPSVKSFAPYFRTNLFQNSPV